ncbi:hypothetical protein AJ78_02726 [Emergomyces pasteurianus Ep9510]|uniref:DUF7587 domain-containing protein n=1 Tax=Emergomyces pasteurianus Ep9510 TaxID=1447872 RepID=A0A1J9PM52_9EURO|nr:hypothetical protein AJ78_02726 [Emergomyces pasteurianus Ep9510]
MSFSPLPADAKPSVLFCAECRANTSFGEGHLCARRKNYRGAPSRQDFDDHLSRTKRPTPFLSFFSSWRRVMQRREYLEGNEEKDIVVIALWAKGLAGVYSVEEVASTLGYPDTGQILEKSYGITMMNTLLKEVLQRMDIVFSLFSRVVGRNVKSPSSARFIGVQQQFQGGFSLEGDQTTRWRI